MNSYRSSPRQGRSRRIDRCSVARRGVLAHRSGSGHPSSHPLASGAHHQSGLSHVLHGSQYRPASDDPSLRAAPRGALSTDCDAGREGEYHYVLDRLGAWIVAAMTNSHIDTEVQAPVAHGPGTRHRHQPAPGPHRRDQRGLRPPHRRGPESPRRRARHVVGRALLRRACSAKWCVPTGSGCGARRGPVSRSASSTTGGLSPSLAWAPRRRTTPDSRVPGAWPSGCLSVVPGPRRESGARAALSGHGLAVATTTASGARRPDAANWAPLEPDAPRLRLAELADWPRPVASAARLAHSARSEATGQSGHEAR